jgi:hypothetical protein
VHEIVPDFSINDLKEALFSGTYSAPVTLRIHGFDENVSMTVVVQSVTKVFEAYRKPGSSGPLGCYELPAYRFEGWLLKSGFDPYPELVRIRCFVETDESGTNFVTGYIQRIPTSPDANGTVEIAS